MKKLTVHQLHVCCISGHLPCPCPVHREKHRVENPYRCLGRVTEGVARFPMRNSVQLHKKWSLNKASKRNKTPETFSVSKIVDASCYKRERLPATPAPDTISCSMLSKVPQEDAISSERGSLHDFIFRFSGCATMWKTSTLQYMIMRLQ